MVIKTDVCFFSEQKIYPGHGKRFVRRDGKLLHFVNNKSHAMYHQGTKPGKLTWTTAWRRLNKKVATTAVTRKRRAKITKMAKPVEGISMDELRRKRTQDANVRSAARNEQLRAIKERNRKVQEKKRVAKKAERKATGGKATKARQQKKDNRAGGGKANFKGVRK